MTEASGVNILFTCLKSVLNFTLKLLYEVQQQAKIELFHHVCLCQVLLNLPSSLYKFLLQVRVDSK